MLGLAEGLTLVVWLGLGVGLFDGEVLIVGLGFGFELGVGVGPEFVFEGLLLELGLGEALFDDDWPEIGLPTVPLDVEPVYVVPFSGLSVDLIYLERGVSGVGLGVKLTTSTVLLKTDSYVYVAPSTTFCQAPDATSIITSVKLSFSSGAVALTACIFWFFV